MNYSFKRKLQMYINSSVVLIFFTVAALVCANIPGVKDWYASFWTQEVSLAIGEFNFFSHNGHSITLGQVINDFLMAVFFLSVGLEIKREIMVGELSSREKALLPVIGACGGMLVPILFFNSSWTPLASYYFISHVFCIIRKMLSELCKLRHFFRIIAKYYFLKIFIKRSTFAIGNGLCDLWFCCCDAEFKRSNSREDGKGRQ